MADGEEHRQQEAPERGAHREMQREVAAAYRPVAEARQRDDADRERVAATIACETTWRASISTRSRATSADDEAASASVSAGELQRRAACTPASQAQRGGDLQQQRRGDVRAARNLGPFIQRGNVVNRKPKKKVGQTVNSIRNECAQIGATAQIEREQRAPRVAREQVGQPPGTREEQVQRAAEEERAVGCGGERRSSARS